ncbi:MULTISPECIES: cell division protein FtsQ/DivIB [unclassified Virgibacillus]|uniref:cell division protein FtsQ/DivIB n=1 Tax=unclassified Virgibacillus TaxID=2620237 RepID=UPI0024DE36E3|nr:cell division protein FtsQ/DivIB [Virgibacillus sp. LDC-1]
MSKKKVVSIEDRIPKLKQARKKKANRRLVFYLSIFFFLLSIIVYLQSPLSEIKNITIQGNALLTDQEVMEKSGLLKHMNIWTINKEEAKTQLLKDPIVEKVEISRQLPWTVDIRIVEQDRVGYIKKENKVYAVLGNGTILKDEVLNGMRGDAPMLLDFDNKKLLDRMTDELSQLPKSILDIISEVYWTPSKENSNKITLYMNDGYIVSGTIRNFADRMQVYPSIVSQLDPKEKGIIHIGVGAYFESFNKKDKLNEETVGE